MEILTYNPEYRDISLLIEVLMEGATGETPPITLALGAFGLHYSATSHISHEIIDLLKTRVLYFNEHSSLIEEDLRALYLMVHVLVARKTWDSRLQSHECGLVKLCEKVSKTNWIRSPRLAAYYLFAFGSFEKFSKITDTAKDFLENRQLQPMDSQQYPFILFGLTLANKSIDNVPNSNIENWLSQLYKSTESLCILAVVLDQQKHSLKSQCVEELQVRIPETFTKSVAPNLSMIRILLAIFHLAELGQNHDEIVDTLERLPLNEGEKQRVTAIIRADSALFVEFRNEMLVQSPIVSDLSFYLFAAKKLSLTQSYIVPGEIKRQFEEFLKYSNKENRFMKVISAGPLSLLLLFFVVFMSYILISIWWPLSNKLYDLILELVKDDLVGSYLDDVLKWVIIAPIYAVFGSSLSIWLRGKVDWHDLSPGGFYKNLVEVAVQIRNSA